MSGSLRILNVAPDLEAVAQLNQRRDYVPIDRGLLAIGEPSCGIETHKLTLDSRAIAPGTAFIAIKGHQLDVHVLSIMLWQLALR